MFEGLEAASKEWNHESYARHSSESPGVITWLVGVLRNPEPYGRSSKDHKGSILRVYRLF